MIIRSYTELERLKTFEERFKYLKLQGIVGQETFGFDRYLNQMIYLSLRWKKVRDKVIIRDSANDLGIDGHNIRSRIIIHHMNVLTVDDVLEDNPYIWDPEFLITTRHTTHNAIHYGDKNLLVISPIVRTPNDTCPWKK